MISPIEPDQGYQHAKPSVYGGYAMRSKVEVQFAQTLDQWQVQWRYEPRTFRLSPTMTYLPDFQIIDDPHRVLDGVQWVEVKCTAELWPYAEALGLPSNITIRRSATPFERGITWSPAQPAIAAVDGGATLVPLLKPALFAMKIKEPVLVVGTPTPNAAVVRFNGNGSAQTRRSHKVTSAAQLWVGA